MNYCPACPEVMNKATVRSEAVVLLFVDSLLIVAPIVGFCDCSMFLCVLLCVVLSSFAIILMGKRHKSDKNRI